MLSINTCYQFCKNHRWALLAGLLTGTSYIPFAPWAILFNFAPLWWYWLAKAENRKQIFWSGWICQFLFNLIGFHWVFHTAHEFGHIPTPISIVVLLLFASLAHLYVPLIGLVFFELKKRLGASRTSDHHSLGLIVSLVGLWALAEIYWPYLFQWHMGYTLLWAKLPIYHFADLIGFQGLSLMLLFFNGFFVYFAVANSSKGSLNCNSRTKRSWKYWLPPTGFVILLFALLNWLGWIHGKTWASKKYDKTLQFLAIQANIGNAEKIMAERGYGYQDFIVQRFITLSKKALAEHPEGQIVVWPESAIPDLLDSEFSQRRRPQLIQKFLTESQRYLITGGYSKEYKGNEEDQTYNSLFIFNPQGQQLAEPYRKKHLLAFGEYTPFSDWFPKLNELSPAGKGFARGPGPMVLTVNDSRPNQTKQPYQIGPLSGLKLAPQICYEALYPEFSRLGVAGGAQILINLTNDSWFGTNSEPYQHLSMTFARAIENRRPLLRVTNTGFTSAIDASGRILAESPLYEEWNGLFSLGYDEKPAMTLYTRYGAYWPFVVLLVTLGGIISVRFRSKKHRIQR
jgi:apolipoprotein N-acyltransferase